MNIDKTAEQGSQDEFMAPRYVEMPQAVKLEVVGSEIGLGIDFTYQPPDKTDPITMRLPLTFEDARQLADMLTSSAQARN